MDNLKWITYLDNLTAWAADKGYTVDFVPGGDDSMCYVSKIIEINSSNAYETQVYCLLHECGHVLIFGDKKSEFLRAREKFNKNTVAAKVYIVCEEREAWVRGRRLAKRLAFQIDDEKWEKNMIRALNKYINWAAN